MLDLLERLSDRVPGGFPVLAVAPDPDDDPIIATAVHGAAGILVTGDRLLQSVERYGETVILGSMRFSPSSGQRSESDAGASSNEAPASDS